MLRLPIFMLTLLTAVAVAAEPVERAVTPAAASANPSPRAIELFERDWVLMNWALKIHDRDRDILLSPGEAQMAAVAFREIADGNGDGRVTPQEYRSAREFIIARY